MKRALLLLLLMPSLVFSQGPIAKIDSICKAFLAQSNVAGFSVSITKDNDVFFARGYGLSDREKGEMAVPETIYPIASVSKLITAVGIMKLVDGKMLQLEDSVMDILPDFPKQEYFDRITVDHLLRHTSGLVDYGKWADSVFLNRGTVGGDKDFIDFIDRPLLFKPGTSFSYSNSGFRTLTMIIEKFGDSSFHDFILKELAEPMDMPSLGAWPQNASRPEATVNYEWHNDSLQIGYLMDIPYDSGDGGLSASVVDIVKLPGLLLKEKLFPISLLGSMLEPTNLGTIKIDYGTGTRLGELLGNKVWGHTGGAGGSTISKLAFFPDDNISIAILINTLYLSKGVLDLEEALLPVLLNIKKPKAKDITENPLAYTGTFFTKNRWGGDTGSTRIISEMEGKLFRDNPLTETPGQQLFYLGENTFRNDFYPFDHFEFHFVEDKVFACSEYANGMFIQVRLKE